MEIKTYRARKDKKLLHTHSNINRKWFNIRTRLDMKVAIAVAVEESFGPVTKSLVFKTACDNRRAIKVGCTELSG